MLVSVIPEMCEKYNLFLKPYSSSGYFCYDHLLPKSLLTDVTSRNILVSLLGLGGHPTPARGIVEGWWLISNQACKQTVAQRLLWPHQDITEMYFMSVGQTGIASL